MKQENGDYTKLTQKQNLGTMLANITVTTTTQSHINVTFLRCIKLLIGPKYFWIFHFFMVVPSCVFKLKVKQQCSYTEGLTIELILSGDPEEWPFDPIPGKALLFGELQVLTAAVELLFFLPLFRPS